MNVLYLNVVKVMVVWVWVAWRDKRTSMAIQGIERMVAAHTEECCICWRASRLHHVSRVALEVFATLFCWVLLLLMGFTLPLTDHEMSENVLDLVADLNLSSVTDEASGGTTFPDDVLQDNLGGQLWFGAEVCTLLGE